MRLRIIMQFIAVVLATIWCICLYLVNNPFWQTVAVFDIGLLAVLLIYQQVKIG